MDISAKHRLLKAAFVIAAGGTGTRMNAGVPKQFLEIAGKPILLHTIEAVSALEAVEQIIIALPAGHIPQAEAILNRQPLRVKVQCVPQWSKAHTSRDGCYLGP